MSIARRFDSFPGAILVPFSIIIFKTYQIALEIKTVPLSFWSLSLATLQEEVVGYLNEQYTYT